MDWAGSWFSIMARLGESTEMVFARLDAHGKPYWHRIPHTQTDGMGALQALLHEPGVTLPTPHALRDPRAPGGFKLAWAILRHIWRMRTQRTHWRSYDPAPTGRSPAVAWQVFDPSDTHRLNALAREQGVSLNSLLLIALDRAVRSRLVVGGRTRWAVPVNMRGAEGTSAETVNQFASIHVLPDPGTSLAALHAQVRARFKEGNHWANWALMHVGKHIGLDRAEEHFRRSYQNPKPGTGGFSSLGEWQSSRVGPAEAWLVCPTTSKLSPVGACAATVNGKLVISLELHPTLHPTPEDFRAVAEAWVSELCRIASIRREDAPGVKVHFFSR